MTSRVGSARNIRTPPLQHSALRAAVSVEVKYKNYQQAKPPNKASKHQNPTKNILQNIEITK